MSTSPTSDTAAGFVSPEQHNVLILKGQKPPTTLISLPTELIWEICSHLSKRDLLSLCRTSQRLSELARPTLYSSIEITSASQYYRIRHLFRKRRDLAVLVKNLIIQDACDICEDYEGAGHAHLFDVFITVLRNLSHLDLRYGWRRWDGLLRSPTGLGYLESLKSCSLTFASWGGATDNIRNCWIMFTHPTLKHLHIQFPHIQFPFHGGRLGRPPRNFRDLDLTGLRGTTMLQSLSLIGVPDAAVLTPFFALPRCLEFLILHAGTLGEVTGGAGAAPILHPLDCLSPLFLTLRSLEIVTYHDCCYYDDALPYHLGRFEAVTDLCIPATHTRLWWPERWRRQRQQPDGVAALLPRSLEALSLLYWDGRSRGPPAHVFPRLAALAAEVAAARRRVAAGPGPFGAWSAVTLHIVHGEDPEDSSSLPAALALPLASIGVRVCVRLSSGETLTCPTRLAEPGGVSDPGGDEDGDFGYGFEALLL